jgi:malonate-semialdehyde dehydrogenase (acetylating) / methylmalonate-semialdehyde dehydrogenase
MNPPEFKARSYDFTPYIDCLNWIGGEWLPAQDQASLGVINPRHGQIIGDVADSGSADVDAAVAAASAAFPAWKATPMKERVQVMYRLKTLMERDQEALAWLVSHENGKTYPESVGSVLKAIECVEMGTALPNMVAGGQLDVSRGVNCQVTHEPLGVCAGISPFNFPMMVPLWMLPQALVAGNTFVLKPSEQVPYSAMALAVLLQEAGLPDGVFNIVNGGRAVVESLCDHDEVKAVGFVGSTRVAKLVYARAAASAKRALCLGGAKNHLVVIPDADVEMTRQNVVASAFGCAGQRCMAASVMLAVGDVQHIIDGAAEITRSMTLGEDMGTIINEASMNRINGYIDAAEAAGCTVIVDGRRAQVEGADGFWVGPTIIDGVSADMPAGCEEIFGPVLSIVRCETLDEAIAIENNNPYGNAAAIYTSNGGTARYAIERFSAGMCGVNIGVPVPREPFSFAGWNDSRIGHGDMTGFDGFRFWTQPRKVTTKWGLQADATWMS